MSIVNINGRKIDIEGYDTMSPEEQQSSQDEIAGQLGHHEEAKKEFDQRQTEAEKTSWQQNPYIAGPVSAAVDTARLAYEHPLAAAAVGTGVATGLSKIAPQASEAVGKVAGAFVPQPVQRAATGLSNLAGGVTQGVSQWGQNVATQAAQKTNTSNLVHYNNIMDRIRLMGDAASPQDIELAKHLHSKLIGESAPSGVKPTMTPTNVAPTSTPNAFVQAAARTAPAVENAGIMNQVQKIALQHIVQPVQQFAQAAANNPIINNPITRGVARLGSVGGQLAIHHGGLNTGEEAELARRRAAGEAYARQQGWIK